MAETISALLSTTQANLTDLFETSQSNGEDSWLTRKVTGSQLIELVNTNAQLESPAQVTGIPIGSQTYNDLDDDFTLPTVAAFYDIGFTATEKNLRLFPIEQIGDGLGFYVKATNFDGSFYIFDNAGSTLVMGLTEFNDVVFIQRFGSTWRARKVFIFINDYTGSNPYLNFNTLRGNSVSKPRMLNLDNLDTPGTIPLLINGESSLSSDVILTMTGNYPIVLPAMNVYDQSLPGGGRIYFLNLGSQLRYDVYYADGSTAAFSLDNQFNCAYLTDNSTANGTLLLQPQSLGYEYNFQTGTSYTLQNSDMGKTVIMTNGSANTVTIPSGLSYRFNCKIQQGGAGQTTISQGSGATVSFKDFSAATSAKLRVKCSSAFITPTNSANIYLVDGDLVL